MIKIECKTTRVFFAKPNEKGTIAVQAFHNKLILQELKTDKNISEELQDGDIKDLPKVVCDFQNVQSIDVVIAILERIKKNIQYDPLNFALAC